MYGVQSQHIRKKGLFSTTLVSRITKSYSTCGHGVSYLAFYPARKAD